MPCPRQYLATERAFACPPWCCRHGLCGPRCCGALFGLRVDNFDFSLVTGALTGSHSHSGFRSISLTRTVNFVYPIHLLTANSHVRHRSRLIAAIVYALDVMTAIWMDERGVLLAICAEGHFRTHLTLVPRAPCKAGSAEIAPNSSISLRVFLALRGPCTGGGLRGWMPPWGRAELERTFSRDFVCRRL